MSRSRVALLVFAVAVAVNLTANAVDATVAVQISKPLLMPALAAYLWFAAREKRRRRPGRRPRGAGRLHRRGRRPAR